MMTVTYYADAALKCFVHIFLICVLNLKLVLSRNGGYTSTALLDALPLTCSNTNYQDPQSWVLCRIGSVVIVRVSKNNNEVLPLLARLVHIPSKTR